MHLIGQLSVTRRAGAQSEATVELLQGDLSAIPPEHAVDALVVSAFPDCYTPNPGTLFEALYRRGLDMQEVAHRKEEDQRARLGCWISERLPERAVRAFGFSRIVCFEPSHPDFVASSHDQSRSIPETVGFVFRCLNNFAIPETGCGSGRQYDLSRVAMPLLAAGNQGVPVEAILPHLLDAAVFWLEEGLPIERLKIVTFKPSDTRSAAMVFSSFAAGYRVARGVGHAQPRIIRPTWEQGLADKVVTEVVALCRQHLRHDLVAVANAEERRIVADLFGRLDAGQPAAASAAPPVARSVDAGPCDIFLSYAHAQGREVESFVEELRRHWPQLHVFYDRASIPAGGQWLRMISSAVNQARVFIAVLSPDYTASPACWDEFQCAKLREYTTGSSVIKTVRLYSEPDLPPIIGIHSYVDCAEGDMAKLRRCAQTILS